MSDVVSFLLWYLVISALGWISFPLTFRFFPKLASKGFAVSRPLGLLVWGFFFWLLCTLGVLQNNLGGQILALLLLAGLSGLALRKGRAAELVSWVKDNWKSLVTIEAVFLVFFVLWAVVRAANPEITATEKPMELAFINSILRSPAFPPQDPWLSGYAISYYYFGYVLVAMLIRITGVVSGVGYNLAAALWFALTAIAAFGMVYDIIAFWKRGREGKETNLYSESAKTVARISGILGSLFVLVVSNLEGLLEILSGAGIFWTKGADSTYTSKFWSWLDILDLNAHEAKPLADTLSRFWGWWRGSRVLQDYKVSGVSVEIIDEFPFFSYLLSDLHPHVLAMPFDLLAMAIALNLFIAGSEKIRLGWSPLEWFKRWEFWLTALVLGSMAFLNTWDFPIYVGLYCLVLIYIRVNQVGWSGKRVGEFLLSGLIFGVTGIVLFLPFFLAFKSQAGGFLPSMEFVTRGAHFWVMFAPLLIPIFAWLVYLWRNEPREMALRRGSSFALYLVGGVWVLSALVGLLAFSLLPLGNQLAFSANVSIANLGQKLIGIGQLFGGIHDSTNGAEVLAVSMQRRVLMAGTWVTLLIMLGMVWGQLAKSVKKTVGLQTEEDAFESSNPTLNANHFLLVLILIGAGLTLFPEFFYLRDQFGWRMNTIFKFYFQAWVFWGIAAACVTVILWSELRGVKRVLFHVAWWVVFAAALCYPAIMVMNKTSNFKPAQWTLDGNAFIRNNNPDEALAEDWLSKAEMGVVAEAIGVSYNPDFARISTHTGLPTVLGWPGHEWQWRGGGTEVGNRESDIKTLYETSNWFEALSIINKYNIHYIYVGSSEYGKYEKLSVQKFTTNLPVAYSNGTVTIYEVPQSNSTETP